MKIRQTCQLTEKQITEISALVEACGQDGLPPLSFPFEDGTSFYLLYDPSLVCALALTMPEPAAQAAGAAAECSAFTHPDVRRRGYFTALFEKAGDEFQDIDLLFPVHPACEDTRKTLEALGAEFDVDELRMDLDLGALELERLVPDGSQTDRLTSGCLKLTVLPSDPSLPERSREEPEEFFFRFHLPPRKLRSAEPAANTVEAGTCRTSVFDRQAGTACLYAFEIVPELRGRGIGKQALYLILRFLKETGVKALSLQVSGDNMAALNLYKKAGFRITETLSYYLY